MSRFLIQISAAFALLGASMAGAPAFAADRVEGRETFARRIADAYRAADREAAISKLFFLDGVDAESLKTYGGIFARLARKKGVPTVAFEPLPTGFDPVYVRDGYEYRPNLTALGYVVLGGNTRLLYGVHQRRHYFPGAVRKAVNPGGPPDRPVQMMVVGIASPPVRFEGFCDVMQRNGKAKRMTLRDEGRGNITSALMARHIVRCEISNTGRRGAPWVQLTEGGKVVFDKRIEPPDPTLSYRR